MKTETRQLKDLMPQLSVSIQGAPRPTSLSAEIKHSSFHSVCRTGVRSLPAVRELCPQGS